MSNTFSVRDAGFNVGVNVRVTKRDKKTGRVLAERQGHNRCLKQQLIGITKFLNGEFNPSISYLTAYDWIPRYLGVGTNQAAGEVAGVSTQVSINDTKLLNEISPRLKLPERNTIINRSSQSYVQLSINTYLPEGWYEGETISEAGLFANETGNNCLFRITFEGIPITADSIVEVSWVISVISIDSQNQAYEDTEKEDLALSMERVLVKIGQLYPDIQEVCEHLNNIAIVEYARSDSTQVSIDNATSVMNEDYQYLTTINPTEDLEKALDDINGEIIL